VPSVLHLRWGARAASRRIALLVLGDTATPDTLRRVSIHEPPARVRRDPRAVVNVIRVAAAVITAVALLAAAVSSVVLLRRFRPDLLLDDTFATGVVVRGYEPRGWVTAHEVALDVAVVGSIVWAATTAAIIRARSGAATAVMLLATAVAVIGCGMAALTWGLIRWDQVALWSVRSGDVLGDGGLWKPAVSDEVRFIIIGDTEFGQASYRRWLLVHLASPVVAATALGASVWLGRRPRRFSGPEQ
jgi:hypothetical protein